MKNAASKNKQMPVHSNRGGSAAKRVINCPGSPREIEKIPVHLRDFTSDAAKQGTAAHALLEKCLKESLNPEDFLGRLIKVVEPKEEEGGSTQVSILKEGAKPEDMTDTFPVDRTMVDGVQLCIDHVEEETERMGEGTKMRVEKRVFPLEEYDDIYGTADITLFNDIELVTIDFKYGMIVVEVRKNEQLRFYSSGGVRKYKRDFKKIKYTLVQPRVYHEDGPIRSETIKISILMKWTEKLREAIKESDKPNAALRAGDWCKFCDAAPKCKTFEKFVAEQTSAEFDEEPDEKMLETIEVAGEELSRRLKWAELIMFWAKAQIAYANRLVYSGEKLPGWKIVRGKSRRALRKDLKLRRMIKRLVMFGFSEEQIFEDKKLKTVAQLEKLLPRPRRKLFNKKFAVKPLGRPVLVPESDPGDEIEVNVGEEFEGVVE